MNINVPKSYKKKTWREINHLTSAKFTLFQELGYFIIKNEIKAKNEAMAIPFQMDLRLNSGNEYVLFRPSSVSVIIPAIESEDSL